MPNETEVKFAVEDLTAAAEALAAAGAECLGAFLETDRFFDTPDGTFRESDCALRLRTVRRLDEAAGADVRPLVTFKGPQQAHERLKVRREVQTRIEDAESLADILDACGLRAMVTVQKRRRRYRLDACVIELDELPLIGCFVEIEGPDERAIYAVRDKLQLTGEPITDSYLHLLEAARPPGEEPDSFTFGP